MVRIGDFLSVIEEEMEIYFLTPPIAICCVPELTKFRGASPTTISSYPLQDRLLHDEPNGLRLGWLPKCNPYRSTPRFRLTRDGGEQCRSIHGIEGRARLHWECLLFVPGSHKWGVLEHQSDEKTTNYKQWCATKSALQERIPDDSVYVPVVGEPGDVFFFDCNMLHGSGHNLSATSRKILIYACADVDNQPKGVE